MDPNAILREIQAAMTIMRINAEGNFSDFCEAAWTLHDSVQALDEWLSDGGYLPADWQGRHSER